MVFVFDENITYRVAEALNSLEQGNKGRTKDIAEVWHILKLGEVLNIPKENPEMSYSDAEVIKIAGMKNATIITMDDDFKRIKQLYNLYKQHNVGVIFLKTIIDNRGYWNMVSYIIGKWFEIKKYAEERNPPFCFIVNKNGIQEYSF